MIEEFQEEQRRKHARVKSMMDYTMGILLLLLGLFFLLYGIFGIKLVNREHSAVDYVIGALFVVYGGWRIYRGNKKDYFR